MRCPPAFHCPRAPSPPLGSPCLMSPSPRQSATGQSPRFTAPHWPQARPRGIRSSWLPQGKATRRGPSAGSGCPMPARVTRKWVSGISTHRVSIRPFHPALDTVSRRVPTFRTLLSSPPAAVDLQRPSRRGALQCRSRAGAWSDSASIGCRLLAAPIARLTAFTSLAARVLQIGRAHV